MDYVIEDDARRAVDSVKPGQLFVHVCLPDTVYLKCSNGSVVALQDGQYYEPARVGTDAILLLEPKVPIVLKRV